LYVPLWLSSLGLAASLFTATVAAAGLAAFAATSRARIRHLADDGITPAKRLLPLTERPAAAAAGLAAADATLTLLVLVCALAVTRAPEAPRMFADPLVPIVAAVLLLFAHAIAWAAAIGQPESVALGLARPICLLGAVFVPLVGSVADRVARGLWKPRGPRSEAGPSELEKLVHVVEENSALDDEEQKMIHGIVELGERSVREVMVPRIDMIAVSRDKPVADVLRRIHTTGHSRIPVYGESIDDIVGILYAKDLLHRLPDLPLDAPAGSLVREAQFVPETKRVDELLHEMQDSKVHMAIVVDEYGGTAGLITIEDLLEEIVGEIRDEYDTGEETWIEPISPREAIFDARVSIHDVNQTLDLDLDDSEYDTLGGLVYARAGKVPAQGEEVHVADASITVLSTAGRRIRKVRVAVEAPSANGTEG
jgi:CBS domain containing-hemolysin-like protein